MRLFLLYFVTIVWLFADVTLLSSNKVANRWKIDYILPTTLEVNETKLIYNGVDINHTFLHSPHSELGTAGLFLIDTSIPMKQAFKKGIKQTIKEIFSLKNSWDRWAIASFDSEMLIMGDYNQSTPDDALNAIKVLGERTELYRASLQAIESLQSQSATRKFLFLFSDGKAEDNAYTYQEVITKATESNITIISFGYKDSVYLQSLRHISEESLGGKLYIAHKTKHLLPQDYIADLNQTIHNNIQISFDANLLLPNEQGSAILKLQLYGDNNQSLSQEIILPVEKIEPTVEIAEVAEPVKDNSLLYYALGAIVLVSLLLFMLLKSKKEPIVEEIEEEPVVELAPDPIAALVTPSGSREYIYKIHSSIGALASNDIVIEGEYISRHHATLDSKDGAFFLIDNNSSNGLYVNYKKISSIELSDGDIISFGPYEVTFEVIY